MKARAVRAALVHESADSHVPAVVHPAENVFNRNAHITEEELAEFAFARHLPQWADIYARRFHVDQQNRQPFVPGDVSVRANNQLAPVPKRAKAGPYLLTVDDVVVAVQAGLGLQTGKIGTGVRFGKTLAPDFFSAQNFGDESLLLRLRPVGDDRGADQPEAESVGHLRRLRSRHLFPENGLLHQRRAAAPILLWPRDGGPAALMELPLPGPQVGESFVQRFLAPLGPVFGNVCVKPRAQFVAELLFLGIQIQVHSKNSFYLSPRPLLRALPCAFDRQPNSLRRRSLSLHLDGFRPDCFLSLPVFLAQLSLEDFPGAGLGQIVAKFDRVRTFVMGKPRAAKFD